MSSSRVARWGIGLLTAKLMFLLLAAQSNATLTLREAVRLGVSEERNTAVSLSKERIPELQAVSNLARSALLPHLTADVYQRRQTINLEAMGIRSAEFFVAPKLVGPFSTFDARGGLVQQLFDLTAIRRHRAARLGLEGAELGLESSKDEAVFLIAVSYLSAVRSQADLNVARSEVSLAEELLEQIRTQKAVGTGTGIEVARAEVQLADRQQRLLVAEAEHERRILVLLRAVGLELDTPAVLSDSSEFSFGSAPKEAEAIAVALKSRPDLQAQYRNEESVKARYAAEKARRWPTFSLFANYGSSGLAPNDSIPTWAAGVRMNIPVYDGGAIEAEQAKIGAQARQEEVRTSDLIRQVELDVRLALTGLRSAQAAVAVSESGVHLAKEELAHARRRYSAGITTSIEVTDAQTRLERAEKNRIEAQFSRDLSHLSLLDAMGVLRSQLGS